MKKYILILGLILFAGAGRLAAQEELIYSQYHFNYYLVNPALAGAENCHHFMLSNRMQWVGMDDFPMTQLLTYKGRVWKNVGIGAYLFNDRNGYSNRAGGQVTFAYHIPLSNGRRYSKRVNYDRQLSFGVSFKLNYFYINMNKLTAADPSVAYDNAFVNTTGWQPNMNVGVYYKSYGGFVGLSFTNIIPIAADLYGDYEMPHPLTWFLFGGYAFDLGSRNDMYLEPMAMIKMNQYWETNLDISLKYGHDVSDFWGYNVQASYRHGFNQHNIQSMNLLLLAGFRIQQFHLGYAITLDLNNLVTQSGATHEIMLGYTLCYQRHFCR